MISVWDMAKFFRRIAPTFAKGAIPGWIVLVWTMLAQGSTAQFALSIVGPITGWLHANEDG
jgi:hypothetical protein